MKQTIFLILTFIFSINTFAQKEIKASDKIVFIYYENPKNNLIVIPNLGKFHTFKIFRKQKSDTSFVLVAEKKKPPLPLRYNITQFAVSWEDTEYHTRDIDYKILAFDRKENELCEMQIIWEKNKE